MLSQTLVRPVPVEVCEVLVEHPVRAEKSIRPAQSASLPSAPGPPPRRACPLPIGPDHCAMMPPRVPATRLPRCNECVRTAAPAAMQRPRQEHRDPHTSTPARRAPASTRRPADPLPAPRSGAAGRATSPAPPNRAAATAPPESFGIGDRARGRTDTQGRASVDRATSWPPDVLKSPFHEGEVSGRTRETRSRIGREQHAVIGSGQQVRPRRVVACRHL
jgi:hypothetical protein